MEVDILSSIGIISSVAGILGLTVKDLIEKVRNRKRGLNPKEVISWYENRKYLASQNAINEVLVRYYGEYGNLKPHKFSIDGKIYTNSLYIDPRFSSVNQTMLTIPMSLEESVSTSQDIETLQNYATDIIAKFDMLVDLKKMKEFHNEPIYILSNLKEKPDFSLKFARVDYLQYRFTTGLLEDELIDALVKSDGDVDKLLGNSDKLMPIRKKIIPNTESLRNLRNRYSQTGIVSAFALRTREDFKIMYQIRSGKVGDKHGAISLIPRAFHSYVVNEEKEVNMHWTVLRELYEELFDGDDAAKDVKFLNHDWYFEKLDQMRWFKEHDSFYLEGLTFGADTFQGGYSMGTLLCIFDSWYYEKYKDYLMKSWESEKVFILSTKDTEGIKKIFDNSNTLGDTKAYFVDALLRLKEIDPSKVALPEIIKI